MLRLSANAGGGGGSIATSGTGNPTLTGNLIVTGTSNLQGAVTLDSTLVFSTAASQIIPGATSLALRNAANSADNILISDAGVVTVRAGLTVTAGALTFGAAASQIIPGATSFAIRNNANTANNLLITDAGVATLAGTQFFVHSTANRYLIVAGSDFYMRSDAGGIVGIGDQNWTTISLTPGNSNTAMNGRTVSGGATLLTLTPGAHTAITAEKNNILLSGTNYTLTDGTTLALDRSVVLNARTYIGAAGGGTETVTAGYTLDVASPIVGANVTVTAKASARFDGLVVGTAALATTATAGFLYIPTCAGTPTGTPEVHAGTVPLIFDTTNNKLYIYDGSWLGGTTPGAFV